MVCEKVFQEEGIFADVTLAEYPLDFIPFDSDILSLELDSAYKVNPFCRTLLGSHYLCTSNCHRRVLALPRLPSDLVTYASNGLSST